VPSQGLQVVAVVFGRSQSAYWKPKEHSYKLSCGEPTLTAHIYPSQCFLTPNSHVDYSSSRHAL